MKSGLALWGEEMSLIWDLMRDRVRTRNAMSAALRSYFNGAGFDEVETPLLVPAPGMEPHIQAFEVPFIPDLGGQRRTLYLHTSPEYAMKRLLAAGSGPIFQLCKVFRNGEVAPLHNPEFTMLEFYRPHASYVEIMQDVERALASVDTAVAGDGFFSRLPYERITVRDALRRETGIDLLDCSDVGSLRAAAQAIGVRASAQDFESVFFQLFLERVEPRLGVDRPTFLVDYPASMASLSRLKKDDPRWAERFELYARGAELANGFSELTDAQEQRARLQEEQQSRASTGRVVYPLDEVFLTAVGQMPPSGGVAVGLDRVLMLMLAKTEISDVLLFPARDFV